MRVVVTGGAGFVGSHLCRELLARGDDVVAIDNLVSGSLRNLDSLFGQKGFSFQHHDVSNYVHVPGPVHAVLHFASPASPSDFARIAIPILKVGSLGTHNTLGLAKDKGAKYFLASTSEVYGDPLVHPQPETYWGNVNTIGPRGVYDEAKRFAEAMTMAYHRSHGVDVRIVRIFNSILADEQVLYDDGRELRREAIGDLAQRLGAPALCDLDGYAVPAFDRSGAIGASAAVALVGHPPTGPCYEVRTSYGRSVRVTGDHSLFVAGRHGRPEARPVNDLRAGDQVAIAGRVEVPVRDRLAVSLADVLGDADRPHGTRDPELPATIGVSSELLWLLGLYVAKGCRYESPRDAFVTIPGDEHTLDQAAKVIERDLGLRCTRSTGAIYAHSRLLLDVLDHLGFTAGPKRVPGWVLGLPLSRLKWFVEGYREGDGDHSGLRFEDVRHEFSTTSDALKDDLVVVLGRFGLVPAIRRSDHRYPFWQLSLADVHPWSPLDWDRGVTQALDGPRWGDVVWATVTSIDEVPPTALVYDFCVPGKENFWAGTGVLCHNTYGPHMRADDGRAVSNFLVQALAGKPITVYGNGHQTRSFCYVDDEVRGLLALLDSDYVGPVNIGNPNEYSILELAKAVLDVTESTSDIHFEPLPVDDPTQRKPDITLARRLLNWEPTVDLATGLARTAEWFRRG